MQADLRFVPSAVVLLALLAPAQEQTRSCIEPARDPGVKTGLVSSAPAEDAAASESPIEPLDGSAWAAPRIRGALAFDRVVHDIGEESALWARGRDYKARFAPDGTQFIPFLGSEAPRNYPVTFTVASLTAGAHDLAFDRTAAPVRHGDEIRFERGPFTELYRVDPGSIEQRFELAERVGAGDVVVRIAVECELVRGDDEHGLRFSNELGGVRYGSAVAFDADGRTQPLETRVEGAELAITVPAAFVAGARFPLTIDPVVTTFAVAATPTLNELAADVVFDVFTGGWVTVWQQQFSASDNDVYVALATDTALVGPATSIDITSVNWANPGVAANRLAIQVLVVAEAGAAGSRKIRGRTYRPADGLSSGQFAISPPEWTVDQVNPVVGGDPTLVAPTYYCVAWESVPHPDDHNVYARLVTVDAATLGSTIPVAHEPLFSEFDPAISRTNGNTHYALQNWTVAWAQRYFNLTETDIYGARIHWDGTITDPFIPFATSNDPESSPCVSPPMYSGLQLPYLVGYVEHGGSGRSIEARVFNGSTWIGTTTVVSSPLGSFSGLSADTDGTQFVLAHTRTTSFPTVTSSAHVSTLHFVDSLGLNEGPLAIGSGQPHAPRVATKFSSGVASRRACIAFETDQISQSDVHQAIYDLPAGGPVRVVCDSTLATCPCGNSGDSGHGCASSADPDGGQLEAFGAAKVSGDTLALYASDLPPNTSCLFFQGTSLGLPTVYGDGLRCTAGSSIRLGSQYATPSGATLHPDAGDPQIHLSGAIPSAGARRYYQVWYRNAASFCMPATFNLTNGLEIVWVP